MPTLALGTLETRENHDMPTASVGMAPFPHTFRTKTIQFYWPRLVFRQQNRVRIIRGPNGRGNGYRPRRTGKEQLP